MVLFISFNIRSGRGHVPAKFLFSVPSRYWWTIVPTSTPSWGTRRVSWWPRWMRPFTEGTAAAPSTSSSTEEYQRRSWWTRLLWRRLWQCTFNTYLSKALSVCPSVCLLVLPFHVFVCSYLHPFVCLFFHLSIFFIRWFIRPSVFLSIYLSVW